MKKIEPKWGWVDDSHISILWNVDDVKTQAKIMKIKLPIFFLISVFSLNLLVVILSPLLVSYNYF